MQSNTYIYGMMCPIAGHIRYVGKANNPKMRFRNHCSGIHGNNHHKNNWIKKLKRQGLKPSLVILEEVDRDSWKVAEKRWITHFRGIGYDLTNICGGGEGCNFGNVTSFKGDKKRPVVGVSKDKSTVVRFDSAAEASLVYKKHISGALAFKEVFTAGKLLWFYGEEYNVMSESEIDERILRACSRKPSSNTNTQFKRGFVPWNSGKGGYSTSKKGYKVPQEVRDKISKTLTGREFLEKRRAVAQIDKTSGEVIQKYNSIKEASAYTGILYSCICNVLSGRAKTGGGFIWL